MTKLERYQQLRARVDCIPAEDDHAEDTIDQVLQLLDELIAAEGGTTQPVARTSVQAMKLPDVLNKLKR